MSTLTIIRAALESDTPVLLWGAPGTGKTSVLEALAKDSEAILYTLIGSTLDPTDVGGVPYPVNGELKVAPPEWAKQIQRDIQAGRKPWLFLDELSCAPPTVQAALLRVVCSRMVGGVSIRSCRILAAANPADTAADGGSLSAATANRWAHVDWAPDVNTWVTGELSGWGTTRSGALAKATALVAAFVQKHPKSLLDVPKTEQSGLAWPSPRSWSAAIRMMALCTLEDREAVMASCVGASTASEFSTWAKAQDLPDPERLLAGKDKMPARGDQVMVALSALVAAALEERPDRVERVTKAWAIIGNQRADTAIMASKALLAGAPGVVTEETVTLGKRILGTR